ncbi:hypothetical protein J1781_11495 [Rahnella sp. C60]|uniref:hypothetical protein n=1 Tax=Rahnella TaxID=34037 RepID=UPI0013EEC84C|nr:MULTISPECIES: hypothetical protein [Rahnella]MBU9815475.1 hypothetical protein [Rahnella perminowiae]MCX2942915.1 hypothetical protein [Rahnella perminowiae]UNK55593.1 hypothetical protein MNO10_23795 [Rahnella aceris]
MNEFQKIWLSAYNGWLTAVSPSGELHPTDYTAAREHADAVLSSLVKAGERAE